LNGNIGEAGVDRTGVDGVGDGGDLVGLYNISPEKSIVEECISNTDTCQSPVDKKMTWVEIVKGDKRKFL